MSEELLVQYCSPTLAGLKTGNMFSCQYESPEQLRGEIRRINKLLSGKGLRIVPLRMSSSKALIYAYRPAMLKADLSHQDSRRILSQQGYECSKPCRCLIRLIQRMQEQGDFPHEVGLFLGYPPEDVQGFIDNNAQCAKCSGCWKVYGDEEKAQRLFAKYRKCSRVYRQQFSRGSSIQRLTVAV